MTAFLSDTLTGAAGTRVDAHTSDSGSGWEGPWGNPSGCKINGTGQAYIEAAATNAGMRSTATPPSADYFVEAVFTRQDTGGTLHGCALYIRHSASDLTCYRLSWDSSGGTWSLRRFDAGGAGTAIGTSTADTWAAGVNKTVRLEVSGSTITGTVNGTTVATASDATIAAAGRCGFLLHSDNGSSTAGMQIDSITGDVSGGGGSPNLPAIMAYYRRLRQG